MIDDGLQTRLTTTDYRLQVTDDRHYRLQTLQATDTTDDRRQTTDYKVQTTDTTDYR